MFQVQWKLSLVRLNFGVKLTPGSPGQGIDLLKTKISLETWLRWYILKHKNKLMVEKIVN
jgi:hypothetical protein